MTSYSVEQIRDTIRKLNQRNGIGDALDILEQLAQAKEAANIKKKAYRESRAK